MAGEIDVFISYSSDTRPWAEELSRALEQAGIRSWATFKDLKPGQRWDEEMEQAMDRAQWCLILVSPQSQTSRRVDAEWRAALTKTWFDSNKTLVPIVIGAIEPPPFLRDWVPLRIDPGAPTEEWTSRVLHVIRSGSPRAERGLSRFQEERMQRLDEIARSAEEMRRRELGADTSPVSRP